MGRLSRVLLALGTPAGLYQRSRYFASTETDYADFFGSEALPACLRVSLVAAPLGAHAPLVDLDGAVLIHVPLTAALASE